MTTADHDKQTALRLYIRELGNVAIAYSGGVDSSLLLYIAAEELGTAAAAITVVSDLFPQRELDAASAFCARYGITHYIKRCDLLGIEEIVANPDNRCYLCKHALLDSISQTATEHGFTNLADGSNSDDASDYRPGLQAVEELGVLSPLRRARLSKAEVRELSRQLGLPTWDQDSFACLATRLPYGEPITLAALKRIELAEQFLIDLGCRQVRVRSHSDCARIECDSAGFDLICQPETRRQVHDTLKAYGFSFVTLDLDGYRSGSMNVTLLADNR